MHRKNRPFHLFCRSFMALCSLALVLAATTPDSGAISSSSASYDGNALVLTGQVALDHGLGKMHAEEAILQKQESGKEFPFSSIELKNGISIELQDHARLHCHHANLDFVSLQGRLSAAEREKVIYTDHMKHGSSHDASLSLMSDLIDLTFEKVANTDKRSDFFIQEVIATGSVVIDYREGLILHAGKALYNKRQERALTAYPTDTFTTCSVSRENDSIHADTIEVDVNRHVLFLKNPKGLFASSLIPHIEKGEVRFHAENLLWDHPQNTLHLQGKPHIEESFFGTLDVENELILIQKDLNGHKTIASLYADGRSILQFQDEDHQEIHHLTCRGHIHLDHLKMHAAFESPATSGTVAEEDQLYYQDCQFAVYADRGMIDYAVHDGRLQPTSISLKGHIRLLSHNVSQTPRFGLADWITYSPTTHTFILSAQPGSRVLFWDEKENLRISAQEIHLTQDGKEQQTAAVKGVGNVQFSFTADEESRLQKIFGNTNCRK